ncbi:MAG: hypothetical protein JW841_00530 [Deltaproteobacteria bacterium]|nr:hypothetical protein [Deltaproteobacteria bacterium]
MENSARHIQKYTCRLDPDRIKQACAFLLSGKASYRALVYLSRTTAADIPVLFEFTRSPNSKERWARLWIVSRFLARLSRDPNAREQITESFRQDVSALYLVSQFTKQKNRALERMFQRLHDELLAIAFTTLSRDRTNQRRVHFLVKIIAAIETTKANLQDAIEKTLGEKAVDDILPLLILVEPKPERESASTKQIGQRLGERLRALPQVRRSP